MTPSAALAPAERALGLIGPDLTEKSLRLHLEGLSGIDAVGLEERAAALGTRSIKTTSKAWALDTIIRLIDLTTLEGADTDGKVRSLVAKAKNPDAADASTPRVAAVCVYGDMVADAVTALGSLHGDPDDGLISVAAVATAFPSGRSSLAIKLADTAEAVAAGADEIDMVIDIGRLKSGDVAATEAEIRAVREAAPAPTVLKVIIESAALTDEEIVAACQAAEAAGADFVKTSTGFHPAGGASTHAVALMRATVGDRLGVKASGGIRDWEAAQAMVAAGASRLGLSGTAAVLDGGTSTGY